MPIKGRIAFGDRLELVVEVDDYFSKRHVEEQFHSIAGYILLLDKFSAFIETERHNRSYERGSGDNRGANKWFLNAVDNR